MQRKTRVRLPCLLTALFFLSACASNPPATTSTIIPTLLDLPDQHTGFRNMLVISVAGDYESRALYERTVAAALANDQGRTIAYYTVVGRQPQLTRTSLETAILSRQFDAVLLTRLQGQDSGGLVPGRPVGQSFDLFGYDYAELNIPAKIERSTAITFVSEIYSTADRKKVWAIDSLSFDKETATDLIIEQAGTIADEIRADGILAP